MRRLRARPALLLTALVLGVAATPVHARAALPPPPSWPERGPAGLAAAQLAWLRIAVNEADKLLLLARAADAVATAAARGDPLAPEAFRSRLGPRDEAFVRAWIEPARRAGDGHPPAWRLDLATLTARATRWVHAVSTAPPPHLPPARAPDQGA